MCKFRGQGFAHFLFSCITSITFGIINILYMKNHKTEEKVFRSNQQEAFYGK
ncbi:hypothetical protein ANACAC_01717 [Anaerostipes caccae L1-92]|uniref:Uncharacterized protein n=1 Tax=Anaerostipes caccae (strain DSM 14662 / CCUG 47493 / JCM 13470 / NCIMB 13811 / L1-92) TaxID=411490 RepID=B0MDS4_ANACD|nr:hypothetical protein ANACAC_01717 [Anaerostipes caccae L1-92]